jgi:hypothetical protein
VAPAALLLAGLILAAAVAWVLLSGSPTGQPVEEDPVDVVPSVMSELEEVVLEPGPERPLPGQGDLQVELTYLGTREEQHLQVTRQGSLVGTIFGPDEDGRPLADAVVTVQGGPQDGLSTRSDTEGRYELTGLIPGTHFFRIDSARNFGVVRLQRVGSSLPTKRDFFIGRPLDVELLIRDHENKALEGARVLVDAGLQEAVTDEHGIALLGGVAGGRRVLVDVRAAGHVPVRYELNLFASGVSGKPVELPALPRGGTVRGRVKSWPGGPLPTITLVPRATQPGAALVAWEQWQAIETDREGRFVIHDVPTTHLLDIRAYHPWGVSDPRMRAVTPSPFTAATVEFVIRASKARISGKVFGPDGKPRAGVELKLLALHPDKVLAALYPGLENSPVGVPLPVPAQMERTTTSAVDGSFSFAVGDHIGGTGAMVLLASADGLRTSRHAVETVGQQLEVHMQSRNTDASLTLVREDDGPLPETALWSVDGAPAETGELTRTGLPEGLYRIRVWRGDKTLWTRDGYYLERGSTIGLSR